MSAALGAVVLGACGPMPEASELTAEESPALEGEVVVEEKTGSGASLTPPLDPYADAVSSYGVAVVLSPDNAVGPPDGQVASFVGLLGAALTLDLGAGEEGNGPLKIYYRGLATVGLVAQVTFMRSDFSIITSTQASLLDVGVGTYSVLVPYNRGIPYRYVRLETGIASLFGLDAVETMSLAGGGGGGGSAFCGDGIVGGAEQCDDGNLNSGDGCSSVCKVEPGYQCQGTHPSVCSDIDECAMGSHHCPPGYHCVNAPGTYYCKPGGCVQGSDLSGCVAPSSP
ncbi:DUF4215 domain-containing protein [Myxococcus stipitatus]|uniref:DUF4215 domain-containing protein n=1 Tax=Myxococcus stipitatus TaxID=83455 RepID=UPI001F1DBEB8|nr:DUF4215 domain-containing protein [Myxococcus stipitatus]MCE9668575.1 DUF4215 domain-containing protein [Myxococcus stipitatus]